MKVIRIIKSPSDIVIPKGMTRKIIYGTAHCTAGPQNQPTKEILNYWVNHNKWKTPGYHYIISYDGTIEQLVEIDQVSNGVAGFNSNNINFCYKGGVDKNGNPVDNRSDAQKASQLMIVKRLKELFFGINFQGHRDFSKDLNGNGIIDSWEWIKSCPSFDFRAWLKSVGESATGESPKTTPYKTISALNMRKQGTVASESIMVIPKGAAIEEISRSGEWSFVKYNGKSGFSSNKYLVK